MSKPIFANYVAAGYPLLWVQTYEEFRAMTKFAQEIKDHTDNNEYNFFSWNRIDGVKRRAINENGVLAISNMDIKMKTEDPMVALQWLESKEIPEGTILFLQDFHHFAEIPIIQRKIKNLIQYFKATGKVLVIISHGITIPAELEKEVTVIQFKLPNVEELKIVLKGVCETADTDYPKDDLPFLEAALGMTSFEAENAFSLSLIEAQCFEVNIINREKAAVVKKTGLLEVIEVTETIDDVGGLDNLKEWLNIRKECFTQEAKNFSIKPPRGALFIGPPGNGKSLTSKVIASIWNRPLLSLDMGTLFGSLVGDSEKNARKCIDIADAVAPCILRIDEIEKAFSNMKDGQAHETSKRVFATFLTWMAERKTDVFIVATANNATLLPPELIRGGRIDVIFYVDFPNESERDKVISIHLEKINRDPVDHDMAKLVKATKGFSSSEIEVWINESLVMAFHKRVELATERLITMAKEVSPISILMAEDIKKSFEWAEQRNVKRASSKEITEKELVAPKRKINMKKSGFKPKPGCSAS